MLIRVNETYSTVIDYRETAPANITLEDYMADPDLLIKSGLSVAVPSQIKGLAMAHQKFGQLPWLDLFQPSIAIARQGFHATEKLTSVIQKFAGQLEKIPALKDIYMKEIDWADGNKRGSGGGVLDLTGKMASFFQKSHNYKMFPETKVWVPKEPGDLIRRENLAKALEEVALSGPDAFYKVCPHLTAHLN